MPNFQNRCSLLLFVFLIFCTSLARADFREADKASAVRNWGKVYQLCKADADLGEKNCQSHLGYLFKYGRGVEKNLVLSAGYLKKCADQQQRNCEEMLGDSYRNGLGVQVDFAQALRLFRLSSAKGNSWAYTNLGNMYRVGQGVPKDPAIAAQHFRSGADLGNGLAQASLADLYRTGDGVEKTVTLPFSGLKNRAVKILEQAGTSLDCSTGTDWVSGKTLKWPSSRLKKHLIHPSTTGLSLHMPT